MSEIRTSRFQALLRQAFALTDRFAPTLLEDVMPVYSIQDPAEAHVQLSKDVFNVFGGTLITPAATDLAVVDLAPAQQNSRAILDVEFISMTSTGSIIFITIEHAGLASSAPPAVTQLTPLDGRRLGSEVQPQRSQFGFSGQLAGVTTPPQFGFAMATPVAIAFRATLYRSSLRFKAGAINQPMRISVYGKERVAEPSEERSRISTSP